MHDLLYFHIYKRHPAFFFFFFLKAQNKIINKNQVSYFHLITKPNQKLTLGNLIPPFDYRVLNFLRTFDFIPLQGQELSLLPDIQLLLFFAHVLSSFWMLLRSPNSSTFTSRFVFTCYRVDAGKCFSDRLL